VSKRLFTLGPQGGLVMHHPGQGQPSYSAAAAVVARIALLMAALVAAIVIASPRPALAVPVTDIEGVPFNVWINTDATFYFVVDWFGDPSVYTYYAMDPNGSDTPPWFRWPPEEDGWSTPPGPAWQVYHYDRITVSDEGTTTVWYWSYEFC